MATKQTPSPKPAPALAELTTEQIFALLSARDSVHVCRKLAEAYFGPTLAEHSAPRDDAALTAEWLAAGAP